MKILLIRPPYARLSGYGHLTSFPLGLGYLASILRDQHHNVAIYQADAPASTDELFAYDKKSIFHSRVEAQDRYFQAISSPKHPVWNEVRGVITAFNPDIVGISLLTPEFASALRVSKIIKDLKPECLLIWGGVHPSILPETCLEHKEVDLVVIGEGEMTFLEITYEMTKSNQDFNKIKGIAYKKNSQIIRTPPRPMIPNLDSLPFPARDLLLFPERNSLNPWQSIIASRGCPWRCTFCTSKEFWGKGVRFRSSANIADELEMMKKEFSSSYFTFWDDAFTIKKELVFDLCDEIMKRRLKVLWKTATRADLINETMLKAMKKAGCVQLELGVESGSPSVLEAIHKDINLDQVREALDLIKKIGISAGTFFMAGFPNETRNDLLSTWEFMRSIYSTDIVLNIFDPMPGSSLFDECIELGLIQEPIDWQNFTYWPRKYFVHKISPTEFDKIIKEMGEWIFKRNNSLKMLLKRLLPKFYRILFTDPKFLIKKLNLLKQNCLSKIKWNNKKLINY